MQTRATLNRIDHKVFTIDWTYRSFHLHTSARTAQALDPLVAAQKAGLIATPGDIDTEGPTIAFEQLLVSNDCDKVLSDDEDDTSVPSSDEDFEIDFNALHSQQVSAQTDTKDYSYRSKGQQVKYAALLFAGDGHFILEGQIVPTGEGDDYTVPVMSKCIQDNMRDCHCKKDGFQVRIDGIQTGVLKKVFERIAAEHYDAETCKSLMLNAPTGTEYDIRRWIKEELAKVFFFSA